MYLKAMCIEAIYDRTVYVSKKLCVLQRSVTGLCMYLKVCNRQDGVCI